MTGRQEAQPASGEQRWHLAGPEIGGGNFVSDTSPEAKAAELRAQAPLHDKRA